MSTQAVAKAAGGLVSIAKKQTVQSTGPWETLRRALAIDPNRSNGVPLNPYYRNPAPGSNDPMSYEEPVTIPAGDIADNPYWGRDHRRHYPRRSVMKQADVASLLTLGSAASPKLDLVGEAGEKKVVAVREEGRMGLAKCLEKAAGDVTKDVFVNGLPPLPSGQSLARGSWDVHAYELVEEKSYTEAYPCRSFQ